MVCRWSLSMRGVTGQQAATTEEEENMAARRSTVQHGERQHFQEETSLKQINSRSHDSTSVAETV